jgi:hypothetical protein
MAGRDRTRQQALHAVGEYRARPVGLDDLYPSQRLCQPGSHPGSYQAAFAKERPAFSRVSSDPASARHRTRNPPGSWPMRKYALSYLLETSGLLAVPQSRVLRGIADELAVYEIP